MIPYWSGDGVDLHLGDCRDILPVLMELGERPCAVVTDPPYEATSAEWDRWPAGWVDSVGAVLPASASLWCFGTERVWLEHGHEFQAAGWRFRQSLLWLKHNGSGPAGRDSLVRVHELAYHWYRGRWGDLHHEWRRVRHDGPDKSVRRSGHADHRNGYRASGYEDDGTRQPRSVTHLVEAPSVRGQGRHQDEKPLATVVPLVTECCPPGGLVLDPFAGAGTTGVAARLAGRRAVLVERCERTAEIAARRLDQGVLTGG